MEEVGVSAAAVLPGAPQPTLCQTSGRRTRKSGSANIFQGVNLRQLRRLFRSAGEPDAEQKARQVWKNRRRVEGDEEDEDGDEVSDEDEGLAQALVGLRVRARNRSGIRAETSRGVRAFGHSRMNERSLSEFPVEDNVGKPRDMTDEEDLRATRSRDEEDLRATRSRDEEDLRATRSRDEEDQRATRSRDEKDPERYLHRIRH